MQKINLSAYLWDASNEGVEYVCTMQNILAYISLKQENDLEAGTGYFAQGGPELVEVPDADSEAYAADFKEWLKENVQPEVLYMNEAQLLQNDLSCELIEQAARLLATALQIRKELEVATNVISENVTNFDFVKTEVSELLGFYEQVASFMK